MALPGVLQYLRIPVIGAPLFIVSNPTLVIAQCTSGIVGSFPALNARPASQLDEWLHEISEALAALDRDHPERPAAPFAVNQIVHRSNDRFEHDMAVCAKWKVPIVITSLGARPELNEAVHPGAGSPCTTSSTTASPARRSTRAPTASSRSRPAPAAMPGAGRPSPWSRKSAPGSTAR